jgi:hypothetical protein
MSRLLKEIGPEDHDDLMALWQAAENASAFDALGLAIELLEAEGTPEATAAIAKLQAIPDAMLRLLARRAGVARPGNHAD